MLTMRGPNIYLPEGIVIECGVFVKRIKQRLDDSSVVFVGRVVVSVAPSAIERAVRRMRTRHVHMTTSSHHGTNGHVDVLTTPHLHARVKTTQLVKESLLYRPVTNSYRAPAINIFGKARNVYSTALMRLTLSVVLGQYFRSVPLESP